MVLFACYLSTEVLRISRSTWLSFWTDQSTSKNYNPGFYIAIYTILAFGQVGRLLLDGLHQFYFYLETHPFALTNTIVYFPTFLTGYSKNDIFLLFDLT